METLGSLEFVGYDEYRLLTSLNAQNVSQWIWVNAQQTTIAAMEVTQPNFPMGRHQWTLTGRYIREDYVRIKNLTNEVIMLILNIQ